MWIPTDMLINDNEYGAPWNDQFYVVTYKVDEDIFTEVMVLSGPRRYTNAELNAYAQMNFGNINVINIKSYHEVYR